MEEGVQPAEPQFGEFKLITTRSIIEGKITNQCIRLLRYQRNRPEADVKSEMDMISRTLSSFPHEKTISALMGLEGASTRAYYNCHSGMLSNLAFEGWNRRPPLDSVMLFEHGVCAYRE